MEALLSNPSQLNSSVHELVLNLLQADLQQLRTNADALSHTKDVFLRDWWFVLESGHPTVQIFLERCSGTEYGGAVDLDTCAAVHRWLLEHEALKSFADSVGVEVGSLGVEPPLRRKEDFARAIGAWLRVETWEPLENRKKYVMILREVVCQDGVEQFILEEGSHRFAIPLQAVKYAQALLTRTTTATRKQSDVNGHQSHFPGPKSKKKGQSKR